VEKQQNHQILCGFFTLGTKNSHKKCRFGRFGRSTIHTNAKIAKHVEGHYPASAALEGENDMT